MDRHLPQQQHYGDPYRTLVPSPQPDHQVHALQYHHQPQPTLMSPPQPQPMMMMSPPQPQQQHHASLASHFHLLHLLNRLADAIGTGTRDQNSDAMVEELTSQFARCQQLLNSISGTISSKSTIEGNLIAVSLVCERGHSSALFFLAGSAPILNPLDCTGRLRDKGRVWKKRDSCLIKGRT